MPAASSLRSPLPAAVLAALLCLPLACAGGADSARLRAAKAALASALPPEAAAEALRRVDAADPRFLELLAAVQEARAADPLLLARVDKSSSLPQSYAPADLAALDGRGLAVSRPGHRLRRAALEALAAMEKAARAQGVTLVVGSAFRSWDYQAGVYARGVAAEGEAETARSVAVPGHSQHQLGTALDFSPIDDSFAGTAASRWLAANARRFGFSNSYPEGAEAVTGYRPESWHWRWLGTAAAALEGEFFGGMQQRLLLFLEALPPPEKGQAARQP